MRRVLLLALLGLLLLAKDARAVPVTFHWQNPCFNQGDPDPEIACGFEAPGPILQDLKEVVLRITRIPHGTMFEVAVPAGTMECDTMSSTVDIPAGWHYEATTRAADFVGNVSCGLAHYVGVVPYEEPPPFSPGLTGTYFATRDFTSPVLTRTDAQIDFNWGAGQVTPQVPGENFSVRWTGRIQAVTTGLTQFRLLVNDAGKLQVGTTMVFNDLLTGDGEHSITGNMSLTAGTAYSLLVEMFEKTGSARAHLYWTRPGAAEELVPASAFTH